MTEVGRAVRDAATGGLVFSNAEADQPRPAGGVPGKGLGTESTPRDFLRSSLTELTAPGALLVVKADASGGFSIVAGNANGYDTNGQVLLNLYAQSFVYYPLAKDWSGWYVLPAIPGQPLTVVKRDPATGWVLGERGYDPVTNGGAIVDVGEFQPDAGRAPALVGLRPFDLLRFRPPREEGSCLPLRPSSGSAPTMACWRLEPAPESGAPSLFDGSGLVLVDLTRPATVREVAERVDRGSFPHLYMNPGPGDELLLVVTDGRLDPASATDGFRFDLDAPLKEDANPSSLARLLDLGPVSGASSTPAPLPLKVTQESGNSRLRVTPLARLVPGHRFRLELDLSSASPDPKHPFAGPTALEFATRQMTGGVVGDMTGPALPLGDTAVARDLLGFGNLLLAAGGTVTRTIPSGTDTLQVDEAHLVALDASDPRAPRPFAVAADLPMAIRSFATDGHDRLFYASRTGSNWSIGTVRLEDVRDATPARCTEAIPGWSSAVPEWARSLPCFAPVEGNVKVSFDPGTEVGLLGSEYFAQSAGLPAGIPVDLEVRVADESGAELETADFYRAYVTEGAPLFSQLVPDARGFYTLPNLVFLSTRQRWSHGLPEASLGRPPSAEERAFRWRDNVCSPSEAAWDRYQRVTIDNLTTSESWSFDIHNEWPGDSPGATDGRALRTIRARRGDRLRVRYNLRTWGYVALLGSGGSDVDLDRFYRTPAPPPPSDLALRTGQCGRRLGTFAGESAGFPACPGVGRPDGFSMTLAVAPLGPSGTKEKPRGGNRIEMLGLLSGFGLWDVPSDATMPGSPCPQRCPAGDCLTVNGCEPAPTAGACPAEPPTGSCPEPTVTCLLDAAPSTRPRDVAVAADVRWLVDAGKGPELLDPSGDLVVVAAGSAGVLVYDDSTRRPVKIGRLALPNRFITRVTVDAARRLVFAGGVDLGAEPSPRPAGWPRVVQAWSLERVVGEPPASGTDPRLVAEISAGWDANHLVFDGATGLLTSWDNGGAGARTVALDDPAFVFSGLYAPSEGAASGAPTSLPRATETFVPLGVPTAGASGHEDGKASAAFRVRLALPGSLAGAAGPDGVLKVRVESLRALPGRDLLAAADSGDAAAVPGGAGWPATSATLTLRRLGNADARLGDLWDLFESDETVLLLADPRASAAYHSTIADQRDPGSEGVACRECDRPSYLDDVPPSKIVELLAGGKWFRVYLDPDAPENQAARDLFSRTGDGWRPPATVGSVAGWADEVPSPAQVSLVEPAENAASWSIGAAGAGVSLASGELLLSASDLGVRGRAFDFTFDRSYRSGLLGYGPLGSAGWGSPLFAHLREIPTTGEVEYHDGEGHVWRFLPNSEELPAGWEPDPAGSYAVPKGLWLRLQKLSGGSGWRLVGRNHDTALFDPSGRLLEMRDRHHRPTKGSAPETGNVLHLSYDAFGRLRLAEDDLGRTHRFEWWEEDPSPLAAARRGLLHRVTVAGRSMELRYDERRRLTEVVLPPVTNRGELAAYSYPSPTIRYSYDPSDGAVPPGVSLAPLHGEWAHLRLGGVTLPGATRERLHVRWSADGRPAQLVLPPVGAAPPPVWAITWRPEGVLGAPITGARLTTPWGHDLDYVLDAGRTATISEEVEAGTATTSFAYEADGRVRSVTNPDGGGQSFDYEPGGDRLAVPNMKSATELADGAVTSFHWHPDNLPDSMLVPPAEANGSPREVRPGVAEAGKSGVVSGYVSEGVSGTSDFDPYGRALRKLDRRSESVEGGDCLPRPPRSPRRRLAEVGKVGGRPVGRPRVRRPGERRPVANLLGNLVHHRLRRMGPPHRRGRGAGRNQLCPGRGPDRAGLRRAGENGPRTTVAERHRPRRDPLGIRRWRPAPVGDRERARPRHSARPAPERHDPLSLRRRRPSPRGHEPRRRPHRLHLSPEERPAEVGDDPAGRQPAARLGHRRADEFPHRRRRRRLARRVGPRRPPSEGVPPDRHRPDHRLRRRRRPPGRPELERRSGSDPAPGQPEIAGGVALRHHQLRSPVAGESPPRAGRRRDAPRYFVSSRAFDASGRVREEWSGDGTTMRRDRQQAFDPAGRPAIAVDAGGNVTTWLYENPAPWPTSIRFDERVPGVDHPVTTLEAGFARDALGRVLEENRSDGSTLFASWDEAGNPLSSGTLTKAGVTSRTSWSWDARGRRIFEGRPSGRGATAYAYDLDGRLRIRQARSASGDPLWETLYGYDVGGRLESIAHPPPPAAPRRSSASSGTPTAPSPAPPAVPASSSNTSTTRRTGSSPGRRRPGRIPPPARRASTPATAATGISSPASPGRRRRGTTRGASPSKGTTPPAAPPASCWAARRWPGAGTPGGGRPASTSRPPSPATPPAPSPASSGTTTTSTGSPRSAASASRRSAPTGAGAERPVPGKSAPAAPLVSPTAGGTSTTASRPSPPRAAPAPSPAGSSAPSPSAPVRPTGDASATAGAPATPRRSAASSCRPPPASSTAPAGAGTSMPRTASPAPTPASAPSTPSGGRRRPKAGATPTAKGTNSPPPAPPPARASPVRRAPRGAPSPAAPSISNTTSTAAAPPTPASATNGTGAAASFRPPRRTPPARGSTTPGTPSAASASAPPRRRRRRRPATPSRTAPLPLGRRHPRLRVGLGRQSRHHPPLAPHLGPRCRRPRRRRPGPRRDRRSRRRPHRAPLRPRPRRASVRSRPSSRSARPPPPTRCPSSAAIATAPTARRTSNRVRSSSGSSSTPPGRASAPRRRPRPTPANRSPAPSSSRRASPSTPRASPRRMAFHSKVGMPHSPAAAPGSGFPPTGSSSAPTPRTRPPRPPPPRPLARRNAHPPAPRTGTEGSLRPPPRRADRRQRPAGRGAGRGPRRRRDPPHGGSPLPDRVRFRHRGSRPPGRQLPRRPADAL